MFVLLYIEEMPRSTKILKKRKSVVCISELLEHKVQGVMFACLNFSVDGEVLVTVFLSKASF